MNRATGLAALLALCGGVILADRPAQARISFEGPLTLLTHGANAEYLTTVGDVATDGAGTWIAAAYDDGDLVFRRSTDGSRTWGAPTQLNDELLTGPGADLFVQLAASSAQAMAVWSFRPHPGNLTTPDTILWIRSDDGGQTWSDPAAIGPETEGAAPSEMVTDDAGTWIVAWAKGEPMSTIHVSRSLDAGQTWTTTEIGTAAAGTWGGGRVAPHLATDKQGRWVAVWHGDEGSVSRAFFSSSADNGMTWSVPAPLDATAGVTGASQVFPDVISDGVGEWAVVWVDIALDGMYLARSTDASTWSAPESLYSGGPPLEPWPGKRYVAFGSEGDGRWIAAWATNSIPVLNEDVDIVFTRSTDAGLTWTPLATLNLSATRDHALTPSLARRNEYISDLVADASGTWVGQYALTTHCCASDAVYLVHSVPDCPSSPPNGCKQPMSPGAATLGLRNELLFRDSVIWKWNGPPNVAGEFGNPLVGSDYAFCLYDQEGGSDVLVYEGEARSAATCGDKPCWLEKNGGYRFRDSRNLVGSTRQVSLKSTATVAKLSVSAAGPALFAPTLPLHADPQVRAVLLNLETGACWESNFSAARTNGIRAYRAESD